MNRRALLRDPALLALLARDVVSSAGSQMTWVALPWFVLTANGLINAPIWTICTLRTPPELRTKVWAAIVASTQLVGPLALLGTGPALDSVGLTETLLAIVGVQTVAALVFMFAGRERSRLPHVLDHIDAAQQTR